MQHDGILVIIFLVLGLVIPAVVFMRVYSTAFSGLNSKSPSPKSTMDETARPEQVQAQETVEKDSR